MKLKKIISGGQTGADRTGLEQAKGLGIPTGGTCPAGCRTEDGPAPELVSEFRLKESFDAGYQVRTYMNVREAEATVWFGTVGTSGYRCTKSASTSYQKPFFENPTKEGFLKILSSFEVVNIAGNRKSVNPDVIEHVSDMFTYVAPYWLLEKARREKETSPQQQGSEANPPGQNQGPGQENRQEVGGPIWDEQARWLPIQGEDR